MVKRPALVAALCALLAFVALVWVSPAKAGLVLDPPEPPPQVKEFRCQAPGTGEIKKGTNPVLVGNQCTPASESYSWGMVVYIVRDCQVENNPTQCKLIQVTTPKDSTTSYETFGGYLSLTWVMKDACGATGSVAKSGYFDTGATAGATPRLLACSGSCGVSYNGDSPQYSALVDGQKHWFAKGSYLYNGTSCTEADAASKGIGTPTPTKPADTCGPNQDSGTVNGKPVCVDKTTGGTTDESKSKETEKTETTKTTNEDGSTTTTETTTKTNADGTVEKTVTTTTTRPDGSSTKDTETTKDEDPEKSRCEKNPSEAGCGGEAALIGDIYVEKDRTVQSVVDKTLAALDQSPVGNAVSAFFFIPSGGTCPTWSAHIPFIDTDVVIDQFCSTFALGALAILKACVLVVASFFAFRIAME